METYIGKAYTVPGLSAILQSLPATATLYIEEVNSVHDRVEVWYVEETDTVHLRY